MTRQQTIQRSHRIALLFNANKVYDREIITGIGKYLLSTRVAWDLFLEEDFRARLNGIEHFEGDGIIADFDDPDVCEALSRCPLPVVAVGSSYDDASKYPASLPYIATDNTKLVSLAYTHLIGAGLQRFALYSLPEAPTNRWAQERETGVQCAARRRRSRRRRPSRAADERPRMESGQRAADCMAAEPAEARRRNRRHRCARAPAVAGLPDLGHRRARGSGDHRHR